MLIIETVQREQNKVKLSTVSDESESRVVGSCHNNNNNSHDFGLNFSAIVKTIV